MVLGGEGNRVRNFSILQVTIPSDRSVIAAGLSNSVLGASHFSLVAGRPTALPWRIGASWVAAPATV